MVRRREDEVFEIIKADPLISQKDIAEKLNITRSSVGVHVNNLTKKGKIIGRGYVLSKVDKICVIGASNIDVWGTSDHTLTKGETSIGNVEISVGGVGRNIAENITKLGMHTEFITAISSDEYGKYIQSYCLKEGVRIDKSNIFKNYGTSFHVAIFDQDNELVNGISDMSIMEQLTPSFINQNRAQINNCNMIVVDLNTPKNTVEFILTNFKHKKILIDPVSINKIDKIKNILEDVQLLKLNYAELSFLADMDVVSQDDVKKACKKVLEKGVEELIITNEYDVICYANKDEFLRAKGEKKEFAHKEGVKEAQFAAIVYGLYNGLSMEETLNVALKAGEITSETQLVVSPWLSVENIYERLEDE